MPTKNIKNLFKNLTRSISFKLIGGGAKPLKGVSAILGVILILTVILTMVMSISLTSWNEQKNVRNALKSAQSYFAAEAGIEDALLRLKKNPTIAATSYNFNIAGGTTSVTISENIGGSRNISAQGNISNRIKKLGIVYTTSIAKISFFYGAQIGNGGIEMRTNSKIQGNIYSNGSILLIEAESGEKSFIRDEVFVASNGNQINSQAGIIEIGKESKADAHAHSCINATIGGKLYWVTGGSPGNCVAEKGNVEQSEEIPKENLPITEEQIQKWKDEACCKTDSACPCLHSPAGDLTIEIDETKNWGPEKIEGSLRIKNKGVLNMKGTIWITGNLIVENGGTIKLDPNYGSMSGLIIVDGKILIENGVTLKGSGTTGSFQMLLSTNATKTIIEPCNLNKIDANCPAIYIGNTAKTSIFYASDGLIVLDNNMEVREITGHKLLLKPNAVLNYDSGLANTKFSGGSGASWQASNWQEIE
ncbi:MAG: hypothetical protein COV69_04135 [Parcubacteria group bacterium CG11_big_fil_rev_8_21_14_0_20_39_14]|nr:MAG: hypothetical protein COV69_04135 [Parcubacteria group bacterium CG11_big_fil_rev_8_21_14_0_20_39_14]